MNSKEVQSMIDMLENSDNSLSTARNLASLYIIQDRQKNANTANSDSVERELNDVLPQYKEYCKVKKNFQLRLIPETALYRQLNNVCKEIGEFITTLYNNTDTPKEREMIKSLLINIEKSL